MSLSNCIIFFVAIFIGIYTSLFMQIRFTQSTNHANNLYAKYAVTACQDALEQNLLDDETDALKKEDDEDNKKNIWNEAETRNNAVNTFYKTLGLCLNKAEDGYYSEMEVMTPVICLVDFDGYYISYNGAYDDLTTSPEGYENIHTITPLNTWAEDVKGYTIRYFLSDYVEVTVPSGVIKRGNREDVYEKIQDSALSFLQDQEEFESQKNACIVQCLNDQIEYYINNLNLKADGYDTQYHVSLPENKGETWGGLIENPCIIGFVQGHTYRIRDQRLSVFGFASYDLSEPLHYFILENPEGEMTYFCYEEKKLKGEINNHDNSLFYNGNQIEEFYESMKECAQKGAYPES